MILFINVFLLLSGCFASAKRIDENEMTESRFNQDIMNSLIRAFDTWNCKVCRFMFGNINKCNLICGNAPKTTTLQPQTTAVPTPQPVCINPEVINFATEEADGTDKCCFYVSCDTQVNWNAARDKCVELGSHLITFESQQQMITIDEIMRILQIPDYKIWIGMRGTNGVYTSILDNSANTASWYPGADQTKPCGILQGTPDAAYGVNSADCGAAFAFICESEEFCVD